MKHSRKIKLNDIEMDLIHKVIHKLISFLFISASLNMSKNLI